MFFLGCKANARVYLAKTGHGPHSSNCCVVLCIVCVKMCTVLLPPGDNPIAATNISYLAKTGHGPHSSNCCVVLCIVCFVSFYVLFVCKCVLYYRQRVTTQLQLTNISYHHINWRQICKRQQWYLLAYYVRDMTISVDLIFSVAAFYVLERKRNV